MSAADPGATHGPPVNRAMVKHGKTMVKPIDTHHHDINKCQFTEGKKHKKETPQRRKK